MYLILQQLSARLAAADEGRLRLIKAAVTREEYAALLDLGRINPEPPLRPAAKGNPATAHPATGPRDPATRPTTREGAARD